MAAHSVFFPSSIISSTCHSFCHPLHIPNNSSLILVELSINDEYEHEHTENMENLLRSLLDLPQKPAVVLISALELNSAMMANGGDIHLPVAMYYGENPEIRRFWSRDIAMDPLDRLMTNPFPVCSLL